MTPPAIASPNERPNDPAAELTPAASLTRYSSIGESVSLFSCDTSIPSPEPVISKGMKSAQAVMRRAPAAAAWGLAQTGPRFPSSAVRPTDGRPSST